MNRNAFRDALIAALWLGGDLDVPGHCELVADIVLAMPEIQALLANEARDAEIERLRTAGDALAEHVTRPCRCVEAHDGAINETCAPCAAFFDWQEARHG